jgi:glycosyltransferase involved in cell wall biosynthesis
MRMKALHSMALGKALVTTPRGAEGLSDISSDPVPVRIGSTAEEFACQVIDLLDHPEERRHLGDQARSFVQRYFSAEAYAGRVEAVYQEMQDEKEE